MQTFKKGLMYFAHGYHRGGVMCPAAFHVFAVFKLGPSFEKEKKKLADVFLRHDVMEITLQGMDIDEEDYLAFDACINVSLDIV